MEGYEKTRRAEVIMNDRNEKLADNSKLSVKK